MLEPCEGKLSSTVLRGEEGREPLALPGHYAEPVIHIVQGWHAAYVIGEMRSHFSQGGLIFWRDYVGKNIDLHVLILL
jgi:hypothetical protein